LAVRIVRLGAPRQRGEGLRIGTVRRPPRGVKKADFARRDFYDLWLPELAPGAALLSYYGGAALTDERWARFAARYRAEMAKSEKLRLIQLLAHLSKSANFAVGCYCEREDRCHRSILRELLRGSGAKVAGR
jgi:uncharacterized protein YeaO (DUF488 family)